MKKKIAETEGAAMIAVLAIMSIFIVLAFALLLAASSVGVSSGKTLPGEKCRIMAVSLSDVVRHSLEEQGETENSIQEYVHRCIGEELLSRGGDDLEMDGEAASRTCTVEDVPEDYEAKVRIYWEIDRPEASAEGSGSMNPGKPALYVETECTLRGQTSRVKARYRLADAAGWNTAETDEPEAGTAEADGTEWRWQMEWRE